MFVSFETYTNIERKGRPAQDNLITGTLQQNIHLSDKDVKSLGSRAWLGSRRNAAVNVRYASFSDLVLLPEDIDDKLTVKCAETRAALLDGAEIQLGR